MSADRISTAAPATPAKRSAVEQIKEDSRGLRGTIALELLQDSDHFGDQDKQLLKFHGSYQQDDRDARKSRSKEGVGKYYMFMVRCKIPGGKMTAEQYLALDELADRCANGTLRITSRQGIQFHGVVKGHLKETIQGINDCLLSTLGACGDVSRNLMAPPAPNYASPVHAQLQHTADILAEHLAPRTSSYHEIWLNGKDVTPGTALESRPTQSLLPSPPALSLPSRQAPSLPSPPACNTSRTGKTVAAGGEGPGVRGAHTDAEPIYGKLYLPRKFKTGLALPEDNSVDIYAQDLGFLADVQGDAIAGYNVLVGGGMGMTHGNANTFPCIAQPMCYIRADQVVAATEAVVKLYRDHGNRGDRKRARIKYLVHDWGVDKFRRVLQDYLPFPLVLPRPIEVREFPLHLGWHPQGDDLYYYGVSIETGRIKDEGAVRLRSALRLLVQRYRPRVRLTPNQDLLLCDLPAHALSDIEGTLTEHGVRLPHQLSPARTHSLACPAIPTCGLAISESERVLPKLIDDIEAELARLGLAQEKLGVRMTGCPNGCVRPYQSDIGIVGRSGDKYTLYVGGNVLGTRLNFVLKDLVPLGNVVATLRPLLEKFRDGREPGEGFGDYCQRLGIEKARAVAGA